MPARAAGTAYGVIEKVLAGFGRFEHLIMVARSSNLIPCGEFGHDKGGRSRTLGQEARSSLSFTVLAPPHTSRRPACVLKRLHPRHGSWKVGLIVLLVFDM